ncbi:MAG TPA: hypothetical protein VIY28_12890 [Pseudonocardiaceae bacterium]
MTTVWVAVILGLLLLCLGALMGSSCTVGVLDQQYRRLAVERQELNERRRTLREARLRLVRCPRCAKLIASSDEDYEDVEDAVNRRGTFPIDREPHVNLPRQRQVSLATFPRLQDLG